MTQGDQQAAGRTWVMVVLMAAYTSNFVDRTIVNVLQQPIKEELRLEDWQLGLLGGTAFAVCYSLVGLFIARLADRIGRIPVLTGSVVLWSVFTALSGLVGSYVQLVALRAGVAVGEAGATPIGHAIISDRYPPEKRAGALAVFQCSVTLGIVLGAVIGGTVGTQWGWRWAFIVAGLPGLLIAVLVWATIREPRRAPAENADKPTVTAVANILFRKKTFRHMLAGCILSAFAGWGFINFAPAYAMRSFDLPLREAGLLGGIGGGLAIGIGTLVGGLLSQRMAVRDRRWMMWAPAAAMVVAIPLCLIAYSTHSLPVWIGCFLALNVCNSGYQGSLFGTNHSLVPARMRAMASAIVVLLLALISLGLGPLFTGIASDVIARASYAGNYADCLGSAALGDTCRAASATGLRGALLLGAIFPLWGAIHLFLAARTIREEVLD